MFTPTPTPTSSLPPCRYGSSCYRVNPQHYAQFSHPAGHVPGRGASTSSSSSSVSSISSASSSSSSPSPSFSSSDISHFIGPSHPRCSVYECGNWIFISPFFNDRHYGEYRNQILRNDVDPKPLIEIHMNFLSGEIREKDHWWEKISKGTVRRKWIKEILGEKKQMEREKPAVFLRAVHVAHVLKELQFYRNLEVESKGKLCLSCIDAVWYSDVAVSLPLKLLLKKETDQLSVKHQPSSMLDWHPDSGSQVLDIVHPSLFCYVNKKSLVLEEKEFSSIHSPIDCLQFIGSGHPVDVNPIMYIPSTSMFRRRSDPPVDPSYSEEYQWLPSEVAVDKEGKCKFISYINNLNPEKHDKLYGLLEEVLETIIPMWERTLMDSLCGSEKKVNVDGQRWFCRPKESKKRKTKEKMKNLNEKNHKRGMKEGDDDNDDDEDMESEKEKEKEKKKMKIDDINSQNPNPIPFSNDKAEINLNAQGDHDHRMQIASDSEDSHEEKKGGEIFFAFSPSPSLPDDLIDHEVSPYQSDHENEGNDDDEYKVFNTDEIEDYYEELEANRRNGNGLDEDGDNDDEDEDDRHDEYMKNLIFRHPSPLPLNIDDRMKRYAHPQSKHIVNLKGKQLQIIVKISEIHLTPSSPKYDGGVWHVEGMKNENIICSGIYYYHSENITTSRLTFRAAVADPPYLQNDSRGVEEGYGLYNEESSCQSMGNIITKEDRVISFPNYLQHQVEPFELEDKTKPGVRKIIVFFLCDPKCPVLSTLHVPPQQLWWGAKEKSLMSTFPVGTLSEYVIPDIENIILSYCCDLSCLDDAIEERKKLMKERKFFVGKNSEEVFLRPFSLCEH